MISPAGSGFSNPVRIHFTDQYRYRYRNRYVGIGNNKVISDLSSKLMTLNYYDFMTVATILIYSSRLEARSFLYLHHFDFSAFTFQVMIDLSFFPTETMYLPSQLNLTWATSLT